MNDLNSDYAYYDLSLLPNELTNFIMCLNVRCIINKTAEFEALLTNLNFPKALLITETWVEVDANNVLINNNSFASSQGLMDVEAVLVFLLIILLNIE